MKDQASEVLKMKKFKNGFINDPVCLSPQDTMEGVKRIKATLGYSGIPITQDRKLGSKIKIGGDCVQSLYHSLTIPP